MPGQSSILLPVSNCKIPTGTITVPHDNITFRYPHKIIWENGDTNFTRTGLAAGNFYYYTLYNKWFQYSKWVDVPYYDSCFVTVTGQVRLDTNFNCLPDAFEPLYLGGATAYFYEVGTNVRKHQANVSTTTGTYTARIKRGDYIVSIPNFMTIDTCQVATILKADSAGPLTNRNLKVLSRSNKTEINTTAYYDVAAPGRDITIGVILNNYGINNLTNVPLRATVSPLLTYVSNSAGAAYNNPKRLLNWYSTSYATRSLTEYFRFKVATTATTGDTIIFIVRASPRASEADTANNTFVLKIPVTNSFDPNYKEVSPNGEFLPADSIMKYRIEFENLGNGPAYDVVIRDTLDTNLDPESFRFLGSSHNSALTVERVGKLVSFYFNDINLRAKTTDPTRSFGDVKFSVKRKPNIPFGTEIKNRAGIYFDYNPVVLTNTTSSTMVSTLAVDGRQAVKPLAINPNPFSKTANINFSNPKQGTVVMKVYNLAGKEVASETFGAMPAGQTTLALTRNSLQPGLYMVKVITAGGYFNGKVVVE